MEGERRSLRPSQATTRQTSCAQRCDTGEIGIVPIVVFPFFIFQAFLNDDEDWVREEESEGKPRIHLLFPWHEVKAPSTRRRLTPCLVFIYSLAFSLSRSRFALLNDNKERGVREEENEGSSRRIIFVIPFAVVVLWITPRRARRRLFPSILVPVVGFSCCWITTSPPYTIYDYLPVVPSCN